VSSVDQTGFVQLPLSIWRHSPTPWFLQWLS